MNRLILIVSLFLSITSCIVSAYIYTTRPTTGFVKADVIFSEFNMTKELKKTLKDAQTVRQNILDSMLLNLRIASSQPNSEQFRSLQQAYGMQKEMFTQQNDELSSKYDQEVWTRINQYMKEYALKEKYDYIFGANGTASLMFASEAHDITPEVLMYMNTSYEGGGK